MEANFYKECLQFVRFESIQNCLGLKDLTMLKKYLTEVFQDLANSKNNQNVMFISKIVFYDYIKLPIFIVDKIFYSFSKLNSGGLCEEEFVDNLCKLYMGSFDEIIKLIFNFLDYDKDGKLKKEDIKTFLSYLPLDGINEDYEFEINTYKINKNDLTYKIYERQIKSLIEINNIVNEAFMKYENRMDLNHFTEMIIKEKNSQIFLQILCLLYIHIPFSEENIESLKNKGNPIQERKDQILDLKNKQNNNTGSTLIKLPKYNTLLAPVKIFFKKYYERIIPLENKGSKSFNDNIYFKNNYNHHNNNIFYQYNNININNSLNNIDYIKNNNNHLYKSNMFYNHNYLNNNINLISLTNNNNLGIKVQPIFTSEYHEYKKNKIIEEIKNDKNKITYENWIYKFTVKSKMKKYYLVLINKDIFYFKTETKKDLDGMHNLTGCYIQESNLKNYYNGKELFCFEIYLNNKKTKKTFFTDDKNICKEFVEKIKYSIGYKKFSDFYEMKEIIGQGKFGIVNLGINKKTGQQVAIKTINKDTLKDIKDIELVKIEIDILKKCHHPNIVRLLDNFEDNEYTYMILEYIEGGNLGEYFKNHSYNFSEEQAANIMIQIANGLKYLHLYGIVHRDLKPNNIMITKQNDSGNIKITDFGLSKIVSPTERMVDGFGTLTYTAPQVITRAPYNKKVDIWSIGVILYKMLSGIFPFDEKDEKKLARKIVMEEFKFDKEHWEKRTKIVQDLIKKCLDKCEETRIGIDEFINHPWFKNNRIKKLSL